MCRSTTPDTSLKHPHPVSGLQVDCTIPETPNMIALQNIQARLPTRLNTESPRREKGLAWPLLKSELERTPVDLFNEKD